MAIVFVVTNPCVLNTLVKDLDDADRNGLICAVPQIDEDGHFFFSLEQ